MVTNHDCDTRHALTRLAAAVLLGVAGSLLLGCGATQDPVATETQLPDTRTPDAQLPDDTVHALQLQLQLSGRGQVSSMLRSQDCHADCVLQVPAGTRLEAIAARGYQFAGWEGDCEGAIAATCVVSVAAQHVHARFMPSPLDVQHARWLRGDMHQHSDHSSDGSLARQIGDDSAKGNMGLDHLIDEAERLALDFLPITDHRTHDQHYDPLWESDSVVLMYAEEANGSPHATVHGNVDMIDQNAAVDGAPGSRVVQESVWLTHSQGAVWVTAHPDDGEMDGDRPNARADAVGVDAVEIWNRASDVEQEIDYIENRWNAGFRFGVVGASDNHFREFILLGGGTARPTTEVLATQRSDRGVIDALRAGRSGVYSGDAGSPKVRIHADFDGSGRFAVQAGDEVLVPAGTPGKLRISVERGLGNRVLVYRTPGRSAAPLAEVSGLGALGFDDIELDIVATDEPLWYRAEVRSLGLADPSSLLFGLVMGGQDFGNLFQQLTGQVRALSSAIFVSPTPALPQGDELPPADAGVPDGAEYALGMPDDFAGFADAVADGQGVQVVAEVHRGDSTDIQWRSRGADQQWSALQVLSDSGFARFPRIARRGQTVAVVWQDESAGQAPRRPQIVLRISRDGGTQFAPPQVIRAIPGRAMHPDVAIAPDGQIHLVWQEIRAAEAFEIAHVMIGLDGQPGEVAILSRQGKTITAARADDARSARHPASVRPAIAIGADGIAWITWQDNRFDPDPGWTGQAGKGEGTAPDDWQIAVMALGAEVQFLGEADAADRHPDLQVDGDGRVHVVWDSKPLRSSGANLRVLAAQRDPGTGTFSVVPLSVPEIGSARAPRLGLDARGVARLAWFDSRSADWRWRVVHARYRPQTADESGWGAGQLINAPGVNTWPVPAGDWLVFASTRYAQRLQRDRTQQIFVVNPEF